MTQFSRLVLGLVAGVLPAVAILTVDSPSNHVTSAFDGVGYLTSAGIGSCSSSLLNDGIHVLTAAHCVSNASAVSVDFEVGGNHFVYTATAWFTNPNFQAGGGIINGDIAVVQLSGLVDASVPRYDIYRGNQEFAPGNNPVTLVGWGREGMGSTGDAGGTSGTTKRAGVNDYDFDPAFAGFGLTPGAFLAFDFDNGLAAQNFSGSTTQVGRGLNEAMIGLGDSGGPTFLNGLIAGVHSWRDGKPDILTDIDGVTNSSFGEVGADSRVSTYSGWVDLVVSGVPEPGTWAMMGIGLALLGAKLRRRQTS